MCFASIAFAISFSVFTFAFDRPMRSSLSLRARRMIVWSEGIADCDEAAVDRGSARSRDLLPDDDLRQPRESALAAAQRRLAGALEHRLPARIERDQRCDAGSKVGFGMDVGGHAARHAARGGASSKL